MKPFTVNNPSIVPAVADTPNGKYAYLHWGKDVDVEIVECLQRKEHLFHVTFCGKEQTHSGDLAWILAMVDPIDNINSSTKSLFWFNFIVDPGNLDLITREFIDLLHTQNKLEIAIAFDEQSYYWQILMTGEQFKQYIQALDQCIASWNTLCDYRKAAAHLHSKVFPELVVQGESVGLLLLD